MSMRKGATVTLGADRKAVKEKNWCRKVGGGKFGRCVITTKRTVFHPYHYCEEPTLESFFSINGIHTCPVIQNWKQLINLYVSQCEKASSCMKKEWQLVRYARCSAWRPRRLGREREGLVRSSVATKSQSTAPPSATPCAPHQLLPFVQSRKKFREGLNEWGFEYSKLSITTYILYISAQFFFCE